MRPRIAPRFLTADEDRAAVARGIRLARRWMAAEPLRGIVVGEVRPGPAVGDGRGARRLRRARPAARVYHPCGTVRMGGGGVRRAARPAAAAARRGGAAGGGCLGLPRHPRLQHQRDGAGRGGQGGGARARRLTRPAREAQDAATGGMLRPEGRHSMASTTTSHAADAEFVRGLRAFFEYRDLGITGATEGACGAHVIRAVPGAHPTGQWHTHDLGFQMFFVLKGWVRFEYEDVGEKTFRAGDSCYQPPAGAPPRDRAFRGPGTARDHLPRGVRDPGRARSVLGRSRRLETGPPPAVLTVSRWPAPLPVPPAHSPRRGPPSSARRRASAGCAGLVLLTVWGGVALGALLLCPHLGPAAHRHRAERRRAAPGVTLEAADGRIIATSGDVHRRDRAPAGPAVAPARRRHRHRGPSLPRAISASTRSASPAPPG